MSNDEIEKSTEELKREAVQIADGILKEEIELLEGADQIWSRIVDLNMVDDETFNTFNFIDDEGGEFPVGSVRKYWNEQKLKELDVKRKEFEEYYKDDIFEACHKLIKKFS